MIHRVDDWHKRMQRNIKEFPHIFTKNYICSLCGKDCRRNQRMAQCNVDTVTTTFVCLKCFEMLFRNGRIW